MNYKPTNDDITFAKNVFDTVIKTQVLNPLLVKEAYKKLFGLDAQNAQQAKIKLFAYFTYQYQEVVKDLVDLGIVVEEDENGMKKIMNPEAIKNAFDKTDTASTKDSAADTSQPQSHEEVIDTTYVGIAEDTPPQNGERDSSELQRLEEEYENAQTPNEKRSLKYKINKLKKDGNNN